MFEVFLPYCLNNVDNCDDHVNLKLNSAPQIYDFLGCCTPLHVAFCCYLHQCLNYCSVIYLSVTIAKKKKKKNLCRWYCSVKSKSAPFSLVQFARKSI